MDAIHGEHIRQPEWIGGERHPSLARGDPVSMFLGFMLDIKRGIFGTSGLQLTDWQAPAYMTIGPFTPSLTSGWYAFDLINSNTSINKLATGEGLIQIRLRFKLDDNNNAIVNCLSLYSGNAGAASRLQLIVEYYVPWGTCPLGLRAIRCVWFIKATGGALIFGGPCCFRQADFLHQCPWMQ